ncbi:MAG TPA: site-specific DNA-methyltransferase, partial [Candidatus Avalokitesvara rifleensis]|uniref:site-specific DNA-methyltransferase n=1 Tax=Candidatus Avalokitesvara rifleensis TaxID=3367620 RepID=UPI0040295B1E
DKTSFDVDVASLHVHERISTRAIIDAVKRPEPPQGYLFADPQLTPDRQIEFYRHDVDWANRLILGDSLLVMNSLMVREGMTSKVQMIYIDPPYGIKYSSNFQPNISQRDVKDSDEHLTREPEQIKAYRDTWTLGIHSYLTYLRDRLLLAKELLHDEGSIFVQINDNNLHLIKAIMDEVFGYKNCVNTIPFKKRASFLSRFGKGLFELFDYIIWYAKDIEELKVNPLYVPANRDEQLRGEFRFYEDGNGIRNITEEDIRNLNLDLSKVFRTHSASRESKSPKYTEPIEINGKILNPPSGHEWKAGPEGMMRLKELNRLIGNSPTRPYKIFFTDFPYQILNNLWDDTLAEQFPIYAVQTDELPIQRCLLMTTYPGDLVFDPTCGSGTTAYCAEKWGRRWITCDTSRVALFLARQRLLTATFPYYELAHPEIGVSGGFIYETVPHITLESIAKNTEIDVITAKYQPQIDQALNDLNKILKKEWEEWEVSRQAESKWPETAKEAHKRFWNLKQAKRKEIDEGIQRNAPEETLYDRPNIDRGKVRVSGPFTVEAIPAPMIEDPTRSPIPQYEEGPVENTAGNHVANMIELLRKGGVVFPGGKKMALEKVQPLSLGMLHAEAEAGQNGKTIRVAVSIGPQYGPVTGVQVLEALQTAKVNAYDTLIFAGFGIDASAQALIQKEPVKGLAVHFANISPDVHMGDLLKTTRASQLFTVFGQPDVGVKEQKDGTYVVSLRGVDIYDPIKGEADHVCGEEVAAWFIDTDYDGSTFRICQAFFPNGGKDPWDKLSRTLKGHIDTEKLDALRGTVSLPFKPGEHKRIAIKVIDFRGNEVMQVVNLK